MRWCIVAALLVTGCGEATPMSPDLSVADLALGMCNDPAGLEPEGGVCVLTVSGTVVDSAGAPVPNLVMSVCAVACFFGKTAADGSFAVMVDSHIVEGDFALLIHARPGYASYYTRLPAQAGDTLAYASPLPLYALPASGPSIKTDRTAQTLTAGDVTLTIAAGTSVQFDVEDVLAGAVGKELRPVAIPDPRKLPFIDPAAPPDALYGFSPFEVTFSQPVTLTFKNAAGLPAGAQVDVQAMGGLLTGPPPAGNFTTVATAHVSTDGLTIAMDPGQGVTALTWVALRKH